MTLLGRVSQLYQFEDGDNKDPNLSLKWFTVGFVLGIVIFLIINLILK